MTDVEIDQALKTITERIGAATRGQISGMVELRWRGGLCPSVPWIAAAPMPFCWIALRLGDEALSEGATAQEALDGLAKQIGVIAAWAGEVLGHA